MKILKVRRVGLEFEFKHEEDKLLIVNVVFIVAVVQNNLRAVAE